MLDIFFIFSPLTAGIIREIAIFSIEKNLLNLSPKSSWLIQHVCHHFGAIQPLSGARQNQISRMRISMTVGLIISFEYFGHVKKSYIMNTI